MGLQKLLSGLGLHVIGRTLNSKNQPEKNSLSYYDIPKKQRGVQKVHFQNEIAEKAYKTGACGLLKGGSKIGSFWDNRGGHFQKMNRFDPIAEKGGENENADGGKEKIHSESFNQWNVNSRNRDRNAGQSEYSEAD